MTFLRRHWLEAVAIGFTILIVAMFVAACIQAVNPPGDGVEPPPKAPALPPHHAQVTATGRLDARHGARQAFEARLDMAFNPSYHYAPDRTRSASNAVVVMGRLRAMAACKDSPLANPRVSDESGVVVTH